MRTLFCCLLVTIGQIPLQAAEPSGEELFPLTTVHRWVYRIQGQDDRLIITAAGTETVNDVRCVRLEGRLQNRLIGTEHIAIKADGAYRSRNFEGADIVPPMRICKFPLKKDETWQADYKVGDKKASIIYGCDEEEVTVPAGKFKAVVVRSESVEGSGKLKTTVWYAPKIGMVKQHIVEGQKTFTLVLDRIDYFSDKEPSPKFPPKKSLK